MTASLPQASAPIAVQRRRRLSKVEQARGQQWDAVQRGRYFRRKYQVERVLSTVMLFAVAPLILLLIVLVRLTSKGAGLYRQRRVGLHGETFDVFKLRTMRADAEADGVLRWSTKGDSRITPLGAILRKTHLDELPQLWNVAKGEMSLTGPRPERPEICEKLAQKIDGYYDRTAVKPGITGIAQINLEPDRTIDDVRRKQCLDLHYIENAGLWLDLRMVMATVMRMVGIRGTTVMRWMKLCRRDVLEAQGLLPEDGHRGGSTDCDGVPVVAATSLRVDRPRHPK
ncbi:sugar transferase [Roseiconus nitratireducens]|uniref:Sugar transferase n=2 Tax=Roseiconus nitratireducens TaxID=2605748 RepID=A0A5M6DFQ7_9BACT|nr:sugar transferase [Roseiconus nitratireducens]